MKKITAGLAAVLMALAITAGTTERAEARHGRWVGGAIAGAIIGGAILHHAYRPYRRHSYYYGDPYYYGYSSYYYPRSYYRPYYYSYYPDYYYSRPYRSYYYAPRRHYRHWGW
jgi:hypothetical protein